MLIVDRILAYNCMVAIPTGSMYGIYANIWGIWMVNVTIIAYMDPMGYKVYSDYSDC